MPGGKRLAAPSVSYSQFYFPQLQSPHPKGPQLATLPLNLTNLLKLFAISQTPESSFPSHPGGRQRSVAAGSRVRAMKCIQQGISGEKGGSPVCCASLLRVGESLLLSPILTAKPPNPSFPIAHHELGPKSLPVSAYSALQRGPCSCLHREFINPGFSWRIQGPWESGRGNAATGLMLPRHPGPLSGCVRSRRALSPVFHGATSPAQPQPRVPPLLPP